MFNLGDLGTCKIWLLKEVRLILYIAFIIPSSDVRFFVALILDSISRQILSFNSISLFAFQFKSIESNVTTLGFFRKRIVSSCLVLSFGLENICLLSSSFSFWTLSNFLCCTIANSWNCFSCFVNFFIIFIRTLSPPSYEGIWRSAGISICRLLFS